MIEFAAPTLVLITIVVTLFRVYRIQNGETHYVIDDSKCEK